MADDHAEIEMEIMEPLFIAYKPVVEIHNAGDRAFLRSILDAAQITYFIQGEHVAPYLFHALPMRLMVREDQADRAREILIDIDFSSADNTPQGSPGDEPGI